MKNRIQKLSWLLTLAFVTSTAVAQMRTNPTSQPGELGTVSWYRTYEEALAASEKANKPVLILFQEIPGCATCRNYGKDVLSNPLLADAIENEFIPLAIYNNKGGADAQILKKYKEPSWNNPVVRIVDSDGVDIAPRVSGNYTAKGLYNAMDLALQKQLIEIPTYFQLLGKELTVTNSNKKDAYYSMYCFWTGEKQLGSQNGVLNTEAGFMSGHEVVKVTYDSDAMDTEALDAFAKANQMQPIPQTATYRWAQNDEDYYLNHTDFKYLPLTALQRTKINTAIGNRQDALKYLSPKQLQWLQKINADKQNKEKLSSSFNKEWNGQTRS